LRQFIFTASCGFQLQCLVRINRTPQLMSQPTPPGDTTPSSASTGLMSWMRRIQIVR
jgi:hypothetical protein